MLLSFLNGVGEGGRRALGVHCPGRKGLHVGESSVSELISNILGKVDRRGFKNEIGDNFRSEPKIIGMGGVVGVELGEMVDELSKEFLAGVPVAAALVP